MARYQPDPHRYPSMWNFEPDDGPGHFYIEGTALMSVIMDRAKEKWPDGWVDIAIVPERIHTRCITYDLYDPSDCDDFLCIVRVD